MVKITNQMKIWLVSLRSTLEPLDQKCQYFLYAQIVNPGPIHTEIILSRKKIILNSYNSIACDSTRQASMAVF